MFACVTVRRRVAASRFSARLTRTQVHPVRADLHTIFTLTLFRMFNCADTADVRTCRITHDVLTPFELGSIPVTQIGCRVICTGEKRRQIRFP